MDVSIKLSMEGGHTWEFECDEDNPMVLGIVSALPGATLDKNLPSDGLIQLENRDGERIFFSRSSLVAVNIRRSGKTAVLEERVSDTPLFYLYPESLDEALAAETLDVSGARSRLAPARQEYDSFDPDSLPPDIVDLVLSLTERANTGVGRGGIGPTHLDLAHLRLGVSATAPLVAPPAQFLHFIVVVDADALLTAEMPLGRTIGLRSRDVLITTADLMPSTIRLADTASTPATLLVGSLCFGSQSD